MNITQSREPPLLSVLIVSFNTKSLTLACLESLFRETRQASMEVIVVDNASGDGSAGAIAAEFPNVKLITSDKNLGFGPANNIAAKHATGQYLLLLNSDTVVINGAVDHLVNFARNRSEALIWGGRTLFADGSLNPSSCWRHMSLWSLSCHATGLSRVFKGSDVFNREAYGGWDRGHERRVEFVSGCFLMLTRDVWTALDGFDERFFMYAEEADLCKRAERLGAAPRVTPEATIIHYGGKSETVQEDKIIRLFAGRMTFALKHWPPWKAKLAQELMLLHCGLRCISESISGALRRRSPRSSPWSSVLKRRKRWINGYPLGH